MLAFCWPGDLGPPWILRPPVSGGCACGPRSATDYKRAYARRGRVTTLLVDGDRVIPTIHSLAVTKHTLGCYVW